MTLSHERDVVSDQAGAPAHHEGHRVGAAPGPDDAELLWREGELRVDGRLADSSNSALVGTVTLDGVSARCIYKPIRGEHPLWDFPDGTLAGREVAAYRLARTAGWDCVPVTVMRDGDFGRGMVQQWIDGARPEEAVDVFAPDEVPDGWLPVLQAEGPDGEPLIVAHADTPELAVLAAFDVLVNNADRKGAHVLPEPGGRVLGVDHGVTFHREPKLRTVLWGWAGRPLPAAVIEGLGTLAAGWDSCVGPGLAELLSGSELAALRSRVTEMIAEPSYPLPPSDRTPIPWPPL